MPYASVDDRYDDHRKIKRAWRTEPAAVAFHAMAITYCSRHVTDGVVDRDWVEEKLALLPYTPKRRQAVLDTLVDLVMFEPHESGGYLVHDYLDHNRSKAQRQALAEQGRRGGQAKAAARAATEPAQPPPDDPGSSEGSSHGYSNGYSQGSSEGCSEGSSTPRHATPTPRQGPAAQAARKRARQPVDQTVYPTELTPELHAVAVDVLPMIRRIWEARGGIEPQQRGIGLAVLRNARCDHRKIARELEHYMLAGAGQTISCDDIVRRYGDWCAKAPAGKAPLAAVPDVSRISKYDKAAGLL